ncbi:EAL and HDOD domain-containing protein [Angustibacter aerolatus]
MTAVPTAAAGAVPAHLLPAPSAVRSSIGREAVHDGVGNVVAYNLRFGVRTSGEAPDLDLELADLVTRAFSQFPIERLGGGRRTLLVNLPRAMAVGAVPVPFGPQAVTLHLLGEYDVDDEVLAGLHVLLEQGFRLCVDATVGGDACEQLLPLVHLLRVAVPEPAPELPELVEYVRGCAPNAQLLAEQIPDVATYEACRAAGFDLFQGVLPTAAPERSAAAPVAGPSQAVCLQVLASLTDPASTTDDHQRIVAADPALSLRILGTVNSASGAGRQVESLRQALVLLGRRSLSAWVTLAAFGGRSSSREDMVDVLTRARTCELLAPWVLSPAEAPAAYAAGLLSGVVDVLGVDAAAVAHEAKLGPALVEVLVHRSGPVGVLVSAVEQFDRTGTTTGSLSTDRLDEARLAALASAIETVDAVLDA